MGVLGLGRVPEQVKPCDHHAQKEWVLGVVRAPVTCPHEVHNQQGSEEVE